VSETQAGETLSTPHEQGAPQSKKSSRRVLVEWALVIIAALIFSLVIRSFLFQTFFIPSGSMEPTLLVGDRIVVSKLSVEWGSINRGDIVVFRSPPSENCGGAPTPDLVKRVVGLPGETIYSTSSTIYIDGKVYRPFWQPRGPISPPISRTRIGANQFFMMGDNNSNSCDSRYWGTLSRSLVVGKVVLRIWPLSRFGTP
jgi:signal peptidase I